MSQVNRRECLKGFLNGLLQTAGTVVLASSVLPARAAEGDNVNPGDDSGKELEQRANQVASTHGPRPEGEGEEFCAFVNGAFRNAGFANGGFRNAGFRNAGFANGGFHNGGFTNGGFTNGGFRNAGFRNF
jgi:cytoplasmic tRNA 2-thiolation protein 1